MTLVEILRRITYALHEYFENDSKESVETASPGSVSSMDDVGIKSKFQYRCSRCGELGRNSATCQDEMRDGTHHWIEVKA